MILSVFYKKNKNKVINIQCFPYIQLVAAQRRCWNMPPLLWGRQPGTQKKKRKRINNKWRPLFIFDYLLCGFVVFVLLYVQQRCILLNLETLPLYVLGLKSLSCAGRHMLAGRTSHVHTLQNSTRSTLTFCWALAPLLWLHPRGNTEELVLHLYNVIIKLY